MALGIWLSCGLSSVVGAGWGHGALPVELPVAMLSRSCCICRFSAGDVVMIQPQNCPEDVQQFCQLLRLDPDKCFLLKPTEPGRCCWLLLYLSAKPGDLLFLCFRSGK